MIFDRMTDAILRHLQHDGRLSNADLAQRVGLSPSACLRRVKLLEKNGIIQGYRAIIDRNATRTMATVIAQITLSARQKTACAALKAVCGIAPM